MVMEINTTQNSGLVDYHVSGIEVPHPHTNAIKHGYSATHSCDYNRLRSDINMCLGYVYYNSMGT